MAVLAPMPSARVEAQPVAQVLAQVREERRTLGAEDRRRRRRPALAAPQLGHQDLGPHVVEGAPVGLVVGDAAREELGVAGGEVGGELLDDLHLAPRSEVQRREARANVGSKVSRHAASLLQTPRRLATRASAAMNCSQRLRWLASAFRPSAVILYWRCRRDRFSIQRPSIRPRFSSR
jgi:hypothetical protein